MSRHTLILHGPNERARLAKWSMTAPMGTRVELKEPKRSIDQNSRMWLMLSEFARQIPWHGVRLSADDWKLMFLDALKREVRIAPNIDGTGFVNLGRSSSDLSKAEMADLFEIMEAFAAKHGVSFPWHAEEVTPDDLRKQDGRAA